MSYQVPHKFIAGEKARASEVNENFNFVSNALNEIIDIATSITSGDSLPMFFPLISDRILTGADAIGWALQGSLVTDVYLDAVNTIKNLYVNGKDIQYRGITCKLSTDGRYIADISQKEAIDKLFTSTGVADFYILDQEYSNFYLPKTKWFFKPCTDTSLVNTYNEAGAPNVEFTFENVTGGIGIVPSAKGALKVKSSNPTQWGGGGSYVGKVDVEFALSNGSSVYGKSDTIQPQSSNKLLYYRVGNTVIKKSSIDIGNVLSELQTKPNIDCSNITMAGINNLHNFSSPKYSDEVILDISSGDEKTFAVPLEGFCNIKVVSISNFNAYVKLNDLVIADAFSSTGNYTQASQIMFKVRKGDIVKYCSDGSNHKNEQLEIFYPLSYQ